MTNPHRAQTTVPPAAQVVQTSDALALDAIAQMLRDPDWGVGMLEDIADLVGSTGRDIEGDGEHTWDRH